MPVVSNSTTNLDQLLSEAAERIKREAYAAGWRDCLAAMNQAVAGLGEPAGIPPIEARLDVGGGGGSPAPVTEVTTGSTPYYVLQTVRNTPGMGSTQIVDAVHDGGHRAAAASIRTTLFRLKDRRLIVQRHRKWFPA